MAPILPFQKALVFVGGGSADVAHSRQFADGQLPVLVGGIVAEETCRDVLFAYLRTPDLPSLCSGLSYARSYSYQNHRQFKSG